MRAKSATHQSVRCILQDASQIEHSLGRKWWEVREKIKKNLSQHDPETRDKNRPGTFQDRALCLIRLVIRLESKTDINSIGHFKVEITCTVSVSVYRIITRSQLWMMREIKP